MLKYIMNGINTAKNTVSTDISPIENITPTIRPINIFIILFIF